MHLVKLSKLPVQISRSYYKPDVCPAKSKQDVQGNKAL